MAVTQKGTPKVKLLLQNVSLQLAPFSLEVSTELQGRITVLFGPSGAGKTSLLDLVAGLRRARSAFIQLDDRVLTDTAQGISVPARSRGIGYVPQDLALFPHLSVRRNLLYGSKAKREGNHALSFERVIDVLEIQPFVRRDVGELSGGERQRVALARALLASPRLLLLDEPLASLDASLKTRIIPYLARIRDEFGIPMIYVTHDRHELLALADEMVVLVNGKVVQAGPVRDVFNRPANLAVAGLLTVETVQPGRIVKVSDELVTVSVAEVLLTSAEQTLPANTLDVYVCIRAEDVILLKGGLSPSSARNRLSATIHSIAHEGTHMRVDLDCGFPLTAILTKQACEELALKPGNPVTALVKAPHIHLIPR
ncbi:MAG TPA: molybdenum ABC transporter ATP-binding protein [Verrucomicrobiae bacterium]|nr:molybdenum ABC transporter ATP-binding protein [Verrucomicrobiae bacterium]